MKMIWYQIERICHIKWPFILHLFLSSVPLDLNTIFFLMKDHVLLTKLLLVIEISQILFCENHLEVFFLFLSNYFAFRSLNHLVSINEIFFSLRTSHWYYWRRHFYLIHATFLKRMHGYNAWNAWIQMVHQRQWGSNIKHLLTILLFW